MDAEKTYTELRKFDDDDVIAIFPDLPYDHRSNLVTSYQTIGQHGAASVELLDDLDVPTKEESTELVAELARIGYNITTNRTD